MPEFELGPDGWNVMMASVEGADVPPKIRELAEALAEEIAALHGRRALAEAEVVNPNCYAFMSCGAHQLEQ